MARAPAAAARRPKVPSAAAGTPSGAGLRPLSPVGDPHPGPAPASQAGPRPNHAAPIALAFGIAVVAVLFNSPLVGALRLPHEGVWRYLAVVAEIGSVVAVLGMLFHSRGAAWAGAGFFVAMSLAVAQIAWPGHLAALLLLVAVVAWQLREPPAQRPVVMPPYPPNGWIPVYQGT